MNRSKKFDPRTASPEPFRFQQRTSKANDYPTIQSKKFDPRARSASPTRFSKRKSDAYPSVRTKENLNVPTTAKKTPAKSKRKSRAAKKRSPSPCTDPNVTVFSNEKFNPRDPKYVVLENYNL